MALIDYFDFSDIRDWMSQRFKKKHKGEIKEVYVKLEHTRSDLIVELAFAATLILAWAFAAWAFLQGHFSWELLLVGLAATAAGIYAMARPFFRHKSPTLKGRADISEEVARADVSANHFTAFFAAPFFVAYIIDKTPQLQPSFWPGSKVHSVIILISLVVYFYFIFRLFRKISNIVSPNNPPS